MSENASNKPPKGSMKISLDGLRKNTTGDFNKLSNRLHDLITRFEKGQTFSSVDRDELIELTDKVGQQVGIFNCVSTDKFPECNDLSESLTIDFLSDMYEGNQ